jgi:hypothetical protein
LPYASVSIPAAGWIAIRYFPTCALNAIFTDSLVPARLIRFCISEFTSNYARINPRSNSPDNEGYPLRDSLDVFRGGIKIGRIVFDGKEPGGLWEPTAEFEPLRELFETENEYSFKAGEDPDNEAAHYEVADRALHEILEHGVEARGLEGRFEFEIIGISIHDGRVTWR